MPKPVIGATVRLIRDISTRGNRKFLAGLRMRICGDDRAFHLEVIVRTQTHYLTLQKKDAKRYFVVESVPTKKDKTDDHHPEQEGS